MHHIKLHHLSLFEQFGLAINICFITIDKSFLADEDFVISQNFLAQHKDAVSNALCLAGNMHTSRKNYWIKMQHVY